MSGAGNVDQNAHHRPVPHWQRTFAKRMRRKATPEEDLLWGMLRGRRFVGHKFRRQVPIGPYIVDFACLHSRLIVELDGSQHADDARDVMRDAWLAAQGFRILRVWNNQLRNETDAVADAVFAALEVPA